MADKWRIFERDQTAHEGLMKGSAKTFPIESHHHGDDRYYSFADDDTLWQ